MKIYPCVKEKMQSKRILQKMYCILIKFIRVYRWNGRNGWVYRVKNNDMNDDRAPIFVEYMYYLYIVRCT